MLDDDPQDDVISRTVVETAHKLYRFELHRMNRTDFFFEREK